MPIKEVTVSKTNPVPELEVFIGDIHLGIYEAILWKSKTEFTVVQKGTNEPGTEKDKFPLATSTASLDGLLLSWEIKILSLTGKKGETYFVRVTLTQGTTQLHEDIYEGPLDGSEFEMGAVRLKVV